MVPLPLNIPTHTPAPEHDLNGSRTFTCFCSHLHVSPRSHLKPMHQCTKDFDWAIKPKPLALQNKHERTKYTKNLFNPDNSKSQAKSCARAPDYSQPGRQAKGSTIVIRARSFPWPGRTARTARTKRKRRRNGAHLLVTGRRQARLTPPSSDDAT